MADTDRLVLSAPEADLTAWSCWTPALAPDGSAVAYVSDRTGAPRVWVQPVDDPDAARPLDTGPEPVKDVSWSPDGHWLAVLIAPGGGEHTQVWAIRPGGDDLRLLSDPPDGYAFFVRWTGRRAILLVAEVSASGQAEAVLIDADHGHRETFAAGELLHPSGVSADHGRVLLRRGPRGRRRMYVADLPHGPERPLLPGLAGTTDFGMLSPDGRTAYLASNAGRDLTALITVGLGDGYVGEPVVLAERPDAELDRFAVSLDGAEVLLVWNVAGRSELAVIDVPGERVRPLPPPPGEVVTSLRLSPHGSIAVLAVEGPDTPSHVVLCDLAGGSYRTLAGYGTLPRHAEPELIRFTARDGLPLTGWLHRATPQAGPCVVYLHGGPEAQERPGFHPLFRALTAAGVNVFAPNVRGSSGFGRAFMEADNGGLRFRAVNDVADCVAELVRRGVAEPSRVAVMGRSYGGYLTLAALVTYPELFRAGVDVCGMSNFATFYQHTEPWIAAAAVSEYGDPVADRELLRALSPIHAIEKLSAPLLVVHGAQDTNVPVIEAEQVVEALAERGVPHRYLFFEDEGHEILRTANRITFIGAVVDWLRTHLL